MEPEVKKKKNYGNVTTEAEPTIIVIDTYSPQTANEIKSVPNKHKKQPSLSAQELPEVAE